MAVVIETTVGDITIDLFTDHRPQTCKNFLKLCKIKYYNFCLFHSIQANFIAQTGDPTGLGTGGESVFGLVYGSEKKYYEAEKLPKIKHNKPGLLSMVNCGNSMLGSQFFVTLGADLSSLDEHCVFAEVTEGLDILVKLNDAICDHQHRPYQDIRITHTVILEDPYEDIPGLIIPDASPDVSSLEVVNSRIGADEKINEEEGLSEAQLEELKAEREAKARATILEIVGDLPDADCAPPENVLFICKLNPVTTDEDLEIIFSRFGKVKSCEVIRDHTTGDSLQYAFVEFEDQRACEQAFLKMDNVLIDDRRIHVDFSQSVSKIRWKGKGRGVQYLDKNDQKEPPNANGSRHRKETSHRDKRGDDWETRDRERDRKIREEDEKVADRDRRRGDEERSRRRGNDRETEEYRQRGGERRKEGGRRREDDAGWRVPTGEDERRWTNSNAVEDDRRRGGFEDDRRRGTGNVAGPEDGRRRGGARFDEENYDAHHHSKFDDDRRRRDERRREDDRRYGGGSSRRDESRRRDDDRNRRRGGGDDDKRNGKSSRNKDADKKEKTTNWSSKSRESGNERNKTTSAVVESTSESRKVSSSKRTKEKNEYKSGERQNETPRKDKVGSNSTNKDSDESHLNNSESSQTANNDSNSVKAAEGGSSPKVTETEETVIDRPNYKFDPRVEQVSRTAEYERDSEERYRSTYDSQVDHYQRRDDENYDRRSVDNYLRTDGGAYSARELDNVRRSYDKRLDTPSKDDKSSLRSSKTTARRKKKKRKVSSSSSSSSESSSSSTSPDRKRKKRSLTVTKKHYHRGKLVKIVKKKKRQTSESDTFSESSDSDRKRKKSKYKKIVKVVKKRKHRHSSDDDDSETSSSDDSDDSSAFIKRKKRHDKVVKKKRKETTKKSKKKKSQEISDDEEDSSSSDGGDYQKMVTSS